MVAHSCHSVHGETILAVDGQDIYFYFGRKKVSAILSSVNIAVKRGTIYSLLGPSGCGKTTLLKCIVGEHKPQTGSLKIYGRSPGSKGFFIPGRGVGYMPQDLALYMEMTTEEILTFFGSLYGMSMKSIKERITFLVQLLELPNKKKLIQCLSGGQQRRVSFAIALIHKPPLLILDEPTVGVDPILRKSIWNHLVSVAREEHLTVIITTHYIEEARQAHTVGLMRNGHMLVEKNPEDLIEQCGGFTLEDAFLKLCEENSNNDEGHETNIDELTAVRSARTKSSATNGMVSDDTGIDESKEITVNFVNTCGGTLGKRNNLDENTTALLPLPSLPAESDPVIFSATDSRKRLFYLTRKNFLRLRRNMFLTFFTISIAAAEVAIFFLCFSSDPFDLPMAIVNEEEASNKLGEKFIFSISNHTISKKPFHNLTLAYKSLEKGKSSAALHINPDFSTCLVDRVLEGVDASNDTILCSRIKLMLDTSNYAVSAAIHMTLLESYQAFATDVLKSIGANPLLGEMPLHVEEYRYGSRRVTAAEYVAPAVILCILYIMGIALTGMCIIAERKNCLLGRSIVAGATTTEVVLSFFFVMLMLLSLQLATMLATAFWVFNLPCNGSVFWVIVSSLCSGICGMSYGFLVSSMTDDENTAMIIGVGSFFPLLFLSATLWPLESMNYYLRCFSYSLPITRLMESTRSVMIRGSSIADNNLWDGYLICSFWVFVQMGLSIIVLKIRK